MGPTKYSVVEGAFVIGAIFLATVVFTLFCAIGLAQRRGKLFVVALCLTPVAVFLVWTAIALLRDIEESGKYPERALATLHGGYAIKDYFAENPAAFKIVGPDDEARIEGIISWLQTSPRRIHVKTNGAEIVNGWGQRIDVALDDDLDLKIRAFGKEVRILDPDSTMAKNYGGGICLFYYDNEGQMSWETYAVEKR